MKQRIRIFWNELSSKFYASDNYTVKDGLVTLNRKYDVTDDIAHACMKYQIEFEAISKPKEREQ